jgi:phosphatidylserine/phosphatidylglycerophosphate/cardiolipin synthase-like enzyme
VKNFNQQLRNHLAKIYTDDDDCEGFAYSLTKGNTIGCESEWLLQTPNVWGRYPKDAQENAASLTDSKARMIPQHVEALIASAETRVDLTTLVDFPDGGFRGSIKKGIESLAKSGRSVKIRILAGLPENAKAERTTYLEELISNLNKKDYPKCALEIYVGNQRTNTFGASWNHSKIVAVDGKKAMVGGENFWSGDYLNTAPVHDLNIALSGPAAYDMHRFINHLWKEVAAYHMYLKPAYWTPWEAVKTGKCVVDINEGETKPIGDGHAGVLGVGRYGTCKPGMDPSDDAYVFAMDYAQDSIYLSQMELVEYFHFFNTARRDALVRALDRNVTVKVVISNPYAYGGIGYPNMYFFFKTDSRKKTARYITNRCKSDDPPLTVKCLRFGPGNTSEWPTGQPFANHAKFMMIDKEVFYIGSHNFYPCNLAEYGVYVQEPDAVKKIYEDYWKPLWTYSCV